MHKGNQVARKYYAAQLWHGASCRAFYTGARFGHVESAAFWRILAEAKGVHMT